MNSLQIKDYLSAGFRPDPINTIADWAEKNFYLPPSAATEGLINLSLVPYIIEPLQFMSWTSPVLEEWIIKAVQIALTTVIEIIIQAMIHAWPVPIIVYFPSDSLAMEFVKIRLEPGFNNNPHLAGLITDGFDRNRKSTLGLKRFPGGEAKFCGGISEKNYRSFSAGVILFDDLDGFPRDIGGTEKRKGQGSPIELGKSRKNARQGKYKILGQGTPTDEKTSLIYAEYLKGDQRKYFICCPVCGQEQIIEWNRIKYEKDGIDLVGDPFLECEKCNKAIHEELKYQMMQPENGARWLATKPNKTDTIVSRWISSAYSLLGYSWRDMAHEHIKAGFEAKRGNFRPMATFYNTKLGLPWSQDNELGKNRVSYKTLSATPRKTQKVPEEAAIITAGIDIQINRIEVLTVGYAENGDRYCIEYKIIGGNTLSPYGQDGSPFNDLLSHLQRTYENTSGSQQPILYSCIDMGFRSITATPFLIEVSSILPISAIFGSAHGRKKKSFVSPATENKYGYYQREINVDEGKSYADNQLKSGRIHFLDHPSFTPEFFKQLTAETFDEEKQTWICGDHVRNEGFDMLVYSHAAFEIYTNGGYVDWDDYKLWNKNGCRTGTQTKKEGVISSGIKL